MRVLLLILLTLSTSKLFGQNGYIKLDNDSTLIGYLKNYISIKDGYPGIELWRTKRDKDPLKISKRKINEYAIEKDTFKVLHQFKPFHDNQTYFEVVDAKLKSRGKVSLYIIENFKNTNSVSTYTGGGLIPSMIDGSLGIAYMGIQNYMYILEDKETGIIKALPSKKEKLKESLMEFFPDKYILKYNEIKGKIDYKSIPDLVKLYNSK